MTTNQPMVESFPAPDESEGFWAFDKLHAPRPVTPLCSDLVTAVLAEGFTSGMAEYDSPFTFHCRHINYYVYAAFQPRFDPEGLEAHLPGYHRALEERVPDVGRRWEEEWQPVIVERNLAEKDTDYESLDDEALLWKLAELKEWMGFMMHVHGHINFVLLSSAKFCDLYDEIVQPEDPTEAYQCLQGWETKSLEASRGLWRLSRLARKDPEVADVFESVPPREMTAALEGSESGRAFLGELRSYLDQFGWRSDAVYDLAVPTWREDPAIPLGVLASYVGQVDSDDPDVRHAEAVKTRRRLVEAARARIAHDPDRLREFDARYEAARHSTPVTENHNYWIDQLGVGLLRRFVLHVGERLARRGQIVEAVDANYLTEEELVDAVRNGTDRRADVARRKEEMGACAQVDPPPELGTPPEPVDDPFMEALSVRMLGLVPPADEVEEEAEVDVRTVKGVGGSPGVVTGPVRVVRSLEEASVLEEGDIMVCEMTLPPWVPLFSIVGGVVTDTGGILSHCAIVAREYGLPTVVGTRAGTSTLRNGMTVTLDGTRGIVTIHA